MDDDIKAIIKKYLKSGPWKAAEITKEETEKDSKVIKDIAFAAGEELLREIGGKFYSYPPKKTYEFGTQEFALFSSLLAELMKTSQISFRLAEEGYYRVAMASLRDVLELVLLIKLFYDSPTDFQEWFGGGIYKMKRLRKKLFRGSEIDKEVIDFSQILSNNRHSMRPTLDAFGKILTNVPYYRKDLFEKWCKHMITLKDLGIKIINHS